MKIFHFLNTDNSHKGSFTNLIEFYLVAKTKTFLKHFLEKSFLFFIDIGLVKLNYKLLCTGCLDGFF